MAQPLANISRSGYVLPMAKRKTHVVYGLFAEGEDLPFYIGRSCDPENRLECHISSPKEERHLAKSRKIASLRATGLSFAMRIAFTTSDFEKVKSMERDLIRLFGRRDIGTGCLMNHTDGGDGTENIVWSDEARKRKSEAMKGSKLNLGRHRPDVSERESKVVHAYGRDGLFVASFHSHKAACTELGLRMGSITQVLRGVNGMKCTRSRSDGRVYQFRREKVDSVPPLTGHLQGDQRRPRVFTRSEEWRHNQSVSLKAAAARRRAQGLPHGRWANRTPG